jgi:transcriptional regulatory protein RtcR
MATLAPSGRIDSLTVDAEVERLQRLWGSPRGEPEDNLADLLPADALANLDPFDRIQLAEVVRVCRRSRSQSEAGRTLFAASRAKRSSTNDADRLRKYLARFDLAWADLST